jgi:DNA-binding NtrC family response regulator
MKPILIVEDEEALASALDLVCRRLGHEAQSCYSGKQALKKVAEKEFAAMLLDIGLPDMSGLEVLKKARRSFPNLPVVVITAHGNLENAVSAKKLGAVAYLVKPLDLQEVQQTLRQNLGRTKWVATGRSQSHVAHRRRGARVAAELCRNRTRMHDGCARAHFRCDWNRQNTDRANHPRKQPAT